MQIHVGFNFMCLKLFILCFLANFTVCSANDFSAGEKEQQEGITNKAVETTNKYTSDETLAISQSAIGNTVGHYRFLLPSGEEINSKKFLGKPLIISLVYTSCYHICPTTTKSLNRVVQKARDVLGKDSFNVLTIGFDSARDTPEAMKHFSSIHSTEVDNWFFLSTDAATIKALVRDLGFIFYPSPQGFDHLIQASILDKNGVVYRQVYGIRPQTPHFVEPLKELVFGESNEKSLLSSITAKINLFCTVYDPAQDKYVYDYSIFIGLIVGCIIGIIFIRIFIREWKYTKSKDDSKSV